MIDQMPGMANIPRLDKTGQKAKSDKAGCTCRRCHRDGVAVSSTTGLCASCVARAVVPQTPDFL
ncbi:hypothetical protein AVP3_0039 [Aeromonas phage AVP3]|nr:hypothetical protein [Aeromonas phage BUCT552]